MYSLNRYPIHQYSPNSAQIPNQLWNLYSPPKELYVRGSDRGIALLEKLPERGLAIVGTRNPQERALYQVRSALQALRGSDLVILSGLAKGIDGMAHQAALNVGLPTIAVLGGGVDVPYPREHTTLMDKILQSDGLLISEFLPNSQPRPDHFIRRNRLIAGWAQATWVVQAGFRSGALNTAKWAREINRQCFVTPCYPGDLACSGNQILLDRDHAEIFWGAHSLGSVWIELSTIKTKIKGCDGDMPVQQDEDLISKYVSQLTVEKGGAYVDELLAWCIKNNWNQERFFVALQDSIKSGRIVDRNGILHAGVTLEVENFL